MMASVLALGLSSVMIVASEDADASAAASSWLAIVDAGGYEESWERASVAFRENMARFGKSVGFWEKALGAARTPLGATVERTLTRSEPTEAMPGGPGGRKYLELVYDSRFENADAVSETLVMTLDDDGAWRMFNYVIRRL